MIQLVCLCGRGRFSRIFRVFDQDSGSQDDVEADGVLAGRLEGCAEGFTLPFGRGANRLHPAGSVKPVELLCKHWLADSQLGDNGIKTLSAGSDAAVGCIVAEPDHLTYAWIVVR